MSAGATMTYCTVKDVTATPANAVYALDSKDVSGNTGVWFDPPNPRPSNTRAKARSVVGASGAAQRAGSW